MSTNNITATQDYVKSVVRTVPNWPAEGVMFRDITPIFQDPKALKLMLDAFTEQYRTKKPDVIAGIDARGFLLGVTISYNLGIPFVPIRKQGKLPFDTITEEYALEYGTATCELHTDACKKGDKVIVIDDLIATGGTMEAGCKLVERLGAEVLECSAIIDLPELGGSKKLKDAGQEVFTLIDFEGL